METDWISISFLHRRVPTLLGALIEWKLSLDQQE